MGDKGEPLDFSKSAINSVVIAIMGKSVKRKLFHELIDELFKKVKEFRKHRK